MAILPGEGGILTPARARATPRTQPGLDSAQFPTAARLPAAQTSRMASIRKEIHIDAPPAQVWESLRDVGALHTRLVPGFVTDTRMEGGTRVVTFANGAVAREHIVGVDEQRRRVAWAIVDAPFRHYSGVAWVEPDINGGTLFVWTADLLPDELAGNVEFLMTTGLQVIKKTQETRHAH
jgi:hypothetical protein